MKPITLTSFVSTPDGSEVASLFANDVFLSDHASEASLKAGRAHLDGFLKGGLTRPHVVECTVCSSIIWMMMMCDGADLSYQTFCSPYNYTMKITFL